MAIPSETPSGASSLTVWALYRRRIGQTHYENLGVYTREADAISDRERWQSTTRKAVFTVVPIPLTPEQRSKLDV